MADPELYVLHLPEDVDEETFDRLLFYLPEPAQARVRRYHHAADRIPRLFPAYYLSTHALLPPPAFPTLTRGPQGKPLLAHPALDPPLDCNASHEGAHVLFAAARGGQVGVDVMVVPAPDEVDELVESLAEQMTPAERRALAVPAPAAAQTLTTLWTIKEGYTKAIGTGIGFGLSRIECELDEGGGGGGDGGGSGGDGEDGGGAAPGVRQVRVDGRALDSAGWAWATGALDGAAWAVIWQSAEGMARDGDGQGRGGRAGTGADSAAGATGETRAGRRTLVPVALGWREFARTFIGSS